MLSMAFAHAQPFPSKESSLQRLREIIPDSSAPSRG
jgi:hypothetical protein